MDQTGISESGLAIDRIFSSDYLQESYILNLIPVGVYVVDMTGIIRKYNEQAASLWGRRPVPGDANECFNGAYKLYQTNGVFLPHNQGPVAQCLNDGLPRKDVEIIIERENLSCIHVRVNILPILNDEKVQVGAISCFYDITEKKEAERSLLLDLKRKTEDLKKSEERYHKMVEEVEDYAILLLNKEGIIQNWNKGAEKIKGWKEEEIVGKSFQEFYLPHDRASGLPLRLLQLARETGKATHEGWRKRKDGTKFWGSIVLTALHDNENNIIGFSKVTRDLTEKKLAEDRLKEYLAQLEFQNKELEQFVYAASHDLKEPLRKIHFYNDFIIQDESNNLSAKTKDYLNRSITAANRMKQLIDDLLGYSRATSSTENYETVDLNKVMSEVVHVQKEELDRVKGTITVDNLPVIQGIPFQLKQLLNNLVENSIKYKYPTRDLHIRVTHAIVKASEVEGFITGSESQYHKISVIDNGSGFDTRYAKKIFEIFQRLNNVSEPHGTGIGLAICKKIVQNHRGVIRASAKLNEGATFSIYLPESSKL
jgi:PAS domain S-box-containing protein